MTASYPSAGPGNAALALGDMHVAGLAADKGFVCFHFAGEFLGRAQAQRANPVIHKPC